MRLYAAHFCGDSSFSRLCEGSMRSWRCWSVVESVRICPAARAL